MTDFINIHTHINDEKCIVNAQLFSALNNGTFYSIGWHPWELNNATEEQVSEWINLNVKLPNVLAIGEIGLDRAIETALAIQKKAFVKLHMVAEQTNKPIIIHCVKAYSDFLGLHKQLEPKITWIFHGFNANRHIANELIKRGCYLSFGERLLKSEKLQKLFSELPLNHIFLETDESDIKIELLYEKAANLHHICIDDLKEQIQQNFKKVFKE